MGGNCTHYLLRILQQSTTTKLITYWTLVSIYGLLHNGRGHGVECGWEHGLEIGPHGHGWARLLTFVAFRAEWESW
jgi:hypothetical protein